MKNTMFCDMLLFAAINQTKRRIYPNTQSILKTEIIEKQTTQNTIIKTNRYLAKFFAQLAPKISAGVGPEFHSKNQAAFNKYTFIIKIVPLFQIYFDVFCENIYRILCYNLSSLLILI